MLPRISYQGTGMLVRILGRSIKRTLGKAETGLIEVLRAVSSVEDGQRVLKALPGLVVAGPSSHPPALCTEIC